MEDYLRNESQIVFEYNHLKKPTPPKYTQDPINVYNKNHELTGYTWNYGDSVIINVNMQDTVLKSNAEYFELAELYFREKLVELNFTNFRSEVKYSFIAPAEMITRFKLNDREDTTIERNTYSLNAVLINPVDGSRTTLYEKPLTVYVK